MVGRVRLGQAEQEPGRRPAPRGLRTYPAWAYHARPLELRVFDHGDRNTTARLAGALSKQGRAEEAHSYAGPA